jgi:outer membrane biosynthesis protein TonB
MKIDDIIALAKAGFTMEQIGELNRILAQPEPEPAPKPKPEPAPKPKPEPVPEPEPAPAPQPYPAKDYQKIFEELTGIKQAIQHGNIGADSFTKPQRTTDDILADLINPPRKGDK